jgi:signal transduction histidine kinase
LAEERERRRIAAELHDRIGQTLAISKLNIGTLKELVPDPDLAKRLEEINSLIDQAIRDTRSLTMELSPPILYELGFEAAVEWLSEQTQSRHDIHVQFASDKQEKPLSQDVQVLLFKIVQELFHNIIKHAGARTAKVSLSKAGEKIKIVVEDDGVGFQTDESGSWSGQANGFGLFSIRERLDHLGGRFEIESRPGHGTRVIVSAPLQQASNKELL